MFMVESPKDSGIGKIGADSGENSDTFAALERLPIAPAHDLAGKSFVLYFNDHQRTRWDGKNNSGFAFR